MAYTEDQIKQLAANELGFSEALDFTSTTDEAVLKINASYELIKNQTLQRYKWGFAETTVMIDTPTPLTDNKYTNRYELPSDFLYFINAYSDVNRVSAIGDYDPPLKGYFDCTVEDEIYLTYTADVDVSLYPDYFVEYIKLKLSFDLCFDITGDIQLLDVLNKREQFEWRNASNIDSRQKRTRRIKSAPYISVRG
jgi:hypothetical protein